MTADDTPTPDPRLCEDIVSIGEVTLRRRVRDDAERARIAEAVAWLMARIRVELRGWPS